MKTILNKTAQTPLVTYNEVDNKLKLEGNIISLENGTFWKNISKEIAENSNLKSLDFDLEYINTHSIRELLILLKTQKVSDLEINWIYVDHDDDMKELGQVLSELCSKKINLVEKV